LTNDKIEFMLSLGKKIYEARKKKGLTQEKLAEEMDINVSYISKIERGEKGISLETFVDFTRILEVDPAYLIDVPNYILSKDLSDLNVLCSKATQKELKIIIGMVKVLLEKRL